MTENTINEKDEILKTKMCKSIEEGRKCTNGENCRFAHRIDQLSIKECIFKDRCTFVRCNDTERGIFYTNNNIKQKLCQFLHPRETIENYLTRMTLSKPFTMPSLLRNSTIQSGHISNPMSHNKSIENGSWTRIIRKTVKHPHLNIVELSEESEEEEDGTKSKTENESLLIQETVVKVPKEAVESALKAILESGKTNIRLEIV
jgi:hypothetical protein